MKQTSNKKRTITQPNALIRAQYRLTLLEKRIIKHAISLINPMRDDNPRTFELPIAEFARRFNLKTTALYTEIKEAATDHFLGRQYGYIDANTKERVRRNWLSEVRYHDKKGTLSITFTPETMALLTEFKKHFTSYDIKNIGNFKSVHAIRLYEICLQEYNSKKNAPCNRGKKGIYFKVTIEELRQEFELENKYKDTSRFIQRVLDKPLAEIEAKSDIKITYTLEKQGRAWHTIKFHVFKKLTQEQIKTKKINKQKSLSNQLAEIDQEIRLRKSNIKSDVAKANPEYHKEQTELLHQARAEKEKLKKKLGIE